MTLRRALFVAIAWIGLSCAASAQTTLVFPALSGRVVDEAGLLKPADVAALTDTLARLEAQTTDQLVVVTLKSLQGSTIEDYGYQLGRRWQIGQKDKNNGALLIVAPTEHAVRIEVGYGLEGTLTDAVSSFIIQNAILPAFKTGDFPGGIKRGVDDIVEILTGDAGGLKQQAETAADNNHPAPDQPAWPIIVLILGAIGLMIYCATRGGAFCRGLTQILFIMMLSGRNGSSGGGGGSSFSGGGGSFGGGGASGHW